MPWMATKIQMQFSTSWSLPREESCVAEAVTVDVMDILGGKELENQCTQGGGRG